MRADSGSFIVGYDRAAGRVLTAVLVTGEAASLLVQRARLEALAASEQERPTPNPVLLGVLMALRIADRDWRGSVSGTGPVPFVDVRGSEAGESVPLVVAAVDRELTVDEAALHAGIGKRAIRKACSQRRLRGRKLGGIWLIEVSEVERFRLERIEKGVAA